MKKVICLVLASVTLAGLLFGCGKQKETPAENFRYTIANGEVTITDFIGTERDIYIPEEIEDRPVTKIDNGAFRGYDLTSVLIPGTVTVISRSAFEDCKCLEKVTLSKGLKVINEFAFYECDSLISVEIPEGVELLEGYAFSDCDSLKEVILPDDFEGFQILSFINSSRTPIDNPIEGSENAVLVVEKGSKAVSLIESYGEGMIPYRER